MSVFDQKQAKALLESSHGKDLTQYIATKIQEIDVVFDIQSTDPVEVAVEVMARKLAAEKLREILDMLLSGEENTMPGKRQDGEFDM